MPWLERRYLLGSEAAQSQIPCWSKLTVLLTKEVDRLTGGRIAQIQLMFVFAALLFLDDVVGRAFQFIGYDRLIFLSDQYAYTASRIPAIKFVDFQLLEIANLFSVAIWGARVLIGIFYLKQYDRFFIEVSKIHRGSLYAALPLGALCLFIAFHISWGLSGTLWQFVLTNFPRLYFLIMGSLWFWSLFIMASGLLFLVWKLFRQYRLGAVLWRDPSQPQGER